MNLGLLNTVEFRLISILKKNALQYGDDIDKGTCNWNGDTFSTTLGFMNGVNVVGN